MAVEGGLYHFLSSSAAPVRDAQGALVSGGTDLAAPVCCPLPSFFVVCVPRRCGGHVHEFHLVPCQVVCERGPTCTPYALPNVCVLMTFLCFCVSFALPGTSMPLAAATTLPTQGFIEYTRDVLMVATAAHALCAATAWGSLLLASIPMYAVSMAASASARRSSNAFSAFGGGADGAPTAAAAAAAPPGRAQVRASLQWRAACGGGACRPACAGGRTPRGWGARRTPMGCCCRAGRLRAPAPWPITLAGCRLDTNEWCRRATGAHAGRVRGADGCFADCECVALRDSAVVLSVPRITSSKDPLSCPQPPARCCTASALATRYRPPSRFMPNRTGGQPRTV